MLLSAFVCDGYGHFLSFQDGVSGSEQHAETRQAALRGRQFFLWSRNPIGKVMRFSRNGIISSATSSYGISFIR